MATAMFNDFVKELKKLNPSVEIVSDALNEWIGSSVAPYKLSLPNDYYWINCNNKCAYINKKGTGNATAYAVVLVEKTQNQTQTIKTTTAPAVEPDREM